MGQSRAQRKKEVKRAAYEPARGEVRDRIRSAKARAWSESRYAKERRGGRVPSPASSAMVQASKHAGL